MFVDIEKYAKTVKVQFCSHSYFHSFNVRFYGRSFKTESVFQKRSYKTQRVNKVDRGESSIAPSVWLLD